MPRSFHFNELGATARCKSIRPHFKNEYYFYNIGSEGFSFFFFLDIREINIQGDLREKYLKINVGRNCEQKRHGNDFYLI